MNLQCLDDEDIRVICDLVFGSLNFPQQLKSSSARIKRCFLWGLLAFQLLITYSYFMRSNHATYPLVVGIITISINVFVLFFVYFILLVYRVLPVIFRKKLKQTLCIPCEGYFLYQNKQYDYSHIHHIVLYQKIYIIFLDQKMIFAKAPVTSKEFCNYFSSYATFEFSEHYEPFLLSSYTKK